MNEALPRLGDSVSGYVGRRVGLLEGVREGVDVLGFGDVDGLKVGFVGLTDGL